MKKAILSLMTISLIGVSLLVSTQPAQGAQDGGAAWVLTEVVDIDCEEEIAKVNKDYKDVFHHEGNYSRNNYTITQTYIGPSDDYYDPPQIHGESASYTASFSAPPQVIPADQEITINISLSGVNNNSYYKPTASVKARIGKSDQSYSRFTNAKGEESFISNIHNNYASFNEKVTAVAPGGSEGDRLEIGFTLNFGHNMETWYVYEWQTVDNALPEVEEPTPAIGEPTPTKCPADTNEEKLAQILKLYKARIPKGEIIPGPIVNVKEFCNPTEEKKFVCGWYQDKVLELLNELKFSADPCQKQLLDNWDYGPIQAWDGYHQAVVIYPKGTDWKSTGIVLDPWLDQTPNKYSITDWAIRFGPESISPAAQLIGRTVGPSFVGIGPSEFYRDEKAYPIVGGDYKEAWFTNDDDLTLKEEHNFIRSLSSEEIEAYKKMPRSERKRLIKQKIRGEDKIQKVIAYCPLNLYLMDRSGNRSGLSGTEILSELPNVSFLILKLTDGTNYTEITYPENAGYTLALEGTDAGQAHVWQGHTFLLGETPPPLQQYSFSVKKGETYHIATDSLGAPMQWEGGSLEPTAVTDISATLLNDLPGLDMPDTLETDDIRKEVYQNNEVIENRSKNITTIWIFFLCCMVSLGFLLIVGLVIVFLVVKRKRKANY